MPRPLEGSYLAELSKQERAGRAETQGDVRRPLWEQPAQEAPEYWMDVSEFLAGGAKDGAENEVLAIGPNGEMVVGHETESGNGRARVVDAKDVPVEARAIRMVDNLTEEYEGMVDTLLKTGGDDGDFSREDLVGMKEALIVEATLTSEPTGEMLRLLRSVTRADNRERQASLIERQGQLRQVQQELDGTKDDPRHRQRLTNTIHAMRREIYKMRREINPKAARADLQKIVDDTGGMLEPYLWRPTIEPRADEVRERIEEISEEMGAINRKGDFSALDELKWYGLSRERKEYEFMLTAAEFRQTHPHLYATDFQAGKEGMRWDARLFSIGKELDSANQVPVMDRVRETSVFRLLRDVYLDMGSQEQTVNVVDSILKSSTAPEVLKDAARALKEDVKAGELPRPETLVKKRKEAAMEQGVVLKENAAKAQVVRDAQRKNPIDIAFELTRNGTPEKRMEVMSAELGMSKDELLGVKRTFDTLRHFGKQFAGMFSEQDFSWSAFLNADPKEMPPAKKGFFGGMKKPKLGGYFSQRQKMIRQLKSGFKRMSKSSRGVVVQSLEQKNANVFNLRG